MQITFYATFRLHAGMKSMTLDLPDGTTMRQVVDAVIQKIPALKRDWLLDTGELHAHVHGFVNGKDVGTFPQGWSTPLKNTDAVDFLPPVAGG
jgi:sulfur-carrier protein